MFCFNCLSFSNGYGWSFAKSGFMVWDSSSSVAIITISYSGSQIEMTTGNNHFSGIDHQGVIISDIDRSRHFYADVLGLEEDTDRPEMSFDGLWFKVGEQAIHCLLLKNPDPVEGRPEHGGRDRHVCLIGSDINALVDRLEQYYIDYTRSKSGRHAIFFHDPDGNAIEVQQRD